MERSDEATCSRVVKCLETVVVGSRSDASDTFFPRFNLNRYNSRDQQLRFEPSGEPDLTMCPIDLSEDQRLIRITCDQTLLTIPCRLLIAIIDRDLIGPL